MPLYGDKKRKYERLGKARRRMRACLAALMRWSGDGTYTHASDLFSNMPHTLQLSRLHELGYVEFIIYPDCSHDKFWRITVKGRAAYNAMLFAEEMKQVLMEAA